MHLRDGCKDGVIDTNSGRDFDAVRGKTHVMRMCAKDGHGILNCSNLCPI